jgi:hypothetical protein
MGDGNVSHSISRKVQGVSVFKLFEATVTADEVPYEVPEPVARWRDAKEGAGDQIARDGEDGNSSRSPVKGFQLLFLPYQKHDSQSISQKQ